ncbi:MAG: tetratricopeptide repeat protein [Cytophagaceae bacterium]
MKNPALFFWNDWNKSDRYIYLFLLLLFAGSLLALATAAYIGQDGVVDLSTFSRLDPIKSVIEQFSGNLITFSTEADNYLIKEWFGASPLQIVPEYSYALLGISCFCMLIIISCLTYLDTIPYSIGMLGVLLFISGLSTELLGIFAPASKYFLTGTVVAFAALSFYFQAFNKNIPFAARLASMLILTLIAWFIIKEYSQVQDPFLYMSNYGIKIILIISLLFFLIIAFDIIYGLFFLLTQSKTSPTKNLILHFPFISFLYLLNFLLFFLDKKGVLDIKVIYINPFILFAVSAIIGIWVFRKRESSFKGLFSFAPIGAYLYLSLGTICCSAISYSFITGNDAMKELFEYGLIYSHFCLGLIFLIYVIANFSSLFETYTQIYKVVFEPKRIPLYVVYLFGGLAIAALLFQSSNQPYHTARAGYLNNLGDIYLHEKNYLLARQYYMEASVEDYDNWRTNYSLASIALVSGEKSSAIDYFALSNSSHPSEYSYLNLSNIYVDNDNFFPAKFALEDGLRRFPESGILYNNLAMVFAKTSMLDSTMHYLTRSKQYSGKNAEVPSTNMIYFLIKNKIYDGADSMIKAFDMQDYLSFRVNTLVLQNMYNKKIKESFDPGLVKDSILDNTAFAYLYNYGINKLGEKDGHYIHYLDSLRRYTSNENFGEYMRYIEALYYYYSGEKGKGKNLLENLKGFAGNTGAAYYNTMGMWMMANHQYIDASENLKQAKALSGNQDINLNYCISLAEAGKKKEALEAFDLLKTSGDKDVKLLVENFIRLLSTERMDSVLAMPEGLRFQYFHLRKKDISEKDLLTVYTSLEKKPLQHMASSEMMEIYIDRDETNKARVFWLASGHDLQAQEEDLGLLNYQYLRFLAAEKNWAELNAQIDPIYLNKDRQASRNYFKALSAQYSGDSVLAGNFFRSALKTDPFNEDGVVWSVEYLNGKRQFMEAYNVLVESVSLNPYSVKILKAYARQSMLINIESYAAYALDKLEELMPAGEFSQFKDSLKTIRPGLE